MLIIRRLRKDPEDAGWIHPIAELEKACFSDPWSEKSVEETLQQDPTILMGAWEEEGAELLGYLILYYVLEEGEIARVAVSPKARRKGVADEILQALWKLCEELGIQKILLDVRKGNKAAIALYQKNGFTEDGVRRSFYTHPVEDALLMSKML